MPDIRRLALNALQGIWLKHDLPKETLETLSAGIEKRDRAFLMELVYGVLRHKDTLDWMLGNFLRNPSKLSPDTINNLRLGIYQIFYMRVPEWASVNEAVRLERARPGVVNAVLRNAVRGHKRLSSELEGMERAALDPSTPPSLRQRYISTLSSHPAWLIKRWIKRFSYEEALRLATLNNTVPPLTLRVNTLRAERADILNMFKGLGIQAEPTRYSPTGIRLREFHNFMELIEGHEELMGLVLAQDEAAQLITYMLEPMPGERVLDACAAPGGKTTHILQLMRDEGEVVAIDSSEKRVSMLKENIARMGFSSAMVIRADATELKDTGVFDRILLDAPCSATGVIRKNPDVRYRHKAGDLLRFQQKQVQMLGSLSRLLKPNGTILYCTCSIEPEEGEEAVRKFLKTAPDFYIIKTDIPFIKTPLLKDGILRTYPQRDDMDGFFGVRICRK